MTTAYDPLTDQVLMAGYSAAATYSGATDKWVRHGNSVRRELGTTGALDPVRRQFVTIGRGTASIHAVSAHRRHRQQGAAKGDGGNRDQGLRRAGPGLRPGQ